MKNKTSNIILLSAVFFTTLLTSCVKYNDWQTDESYKRLFSPTQLTATVSGVSVVVGWMPVAGATGYVVEISKDSLVFGNIEQTIETEGEKLEEGSNRLTVSITENLDALSRYSVRVKAVGQNIPESKWSLATFVTETEQIMYNVGIEDIQPRAVTLKWVIPNNVTHFMLNGVRYDISANEATAGEKLITDLTPKTTYTATLYNNLSIRGTQTFTTKADIPTGDNVIEVGADDDLAAMLTGPITPGTIFVLYQGSVYKSDESIVLPANASFTIWGEDGPQKPVLAFNGITLPANAETIKFESLDITGYQDVTGGVKRNYVFNQSAASNTGEIIFENCIVRNFVNTPMRLQGSAAITVDKFAMNKCIVYDISDNGSNGAYALIHTNVATGRINNIELTNSTFYRIGYGIILHNAAPSQSVLIDNCTFYNVVGNSRYFIDYNAQSAGTLQMNNTILAKTYSPTNTGRGVRAGSNVLVNNFYQAADVVFAGNTIAGVVSYSGTGADLFTEPDNGNFLIKDNAFGGRSTAGDPQWRP